MNVEWDTLAALATSIGVGIAAWQIRESRILAQVAFEDSLDQQYRSLIMQIPMDAMIGEDVSIVSNSVVREAIYNYIDLCNEQTFLRKNRRICKERWKAWNEGIRYNLQKPAFRSVWDEVKLRAPSEFTALTKLELDEFNSDPAEWV